MPPADRIAFILFWCIAGLAVALTCINLGWVPGGNGGNADWFGVAASPTVALVACVALWRSLGQE